MEEKKAPLGRRTHYLLACMALGLALVGCESSTDGGGGAAASGICDPGPIDPTPDGSTEFEPDDIEAARNADCLVVVYCDDVESEAQLVGCLSHVVPGDVCEQSTAAKRAAVATYIDETADDRVCD